LILVKGVAEAATREDTVEVKAARARLAEKVGHTVAVAR